MTGPDRAAIDRAMDELDAITTEGPFKRWRWSIPARPDHDSDLIIADGLKTAMELAAQAAEVVAERDATIARVRELAEKLINAADPGDGPAPATLQTAAAAAERQHAAHVAHQFLAALDGAS